MNAEPASVTATVAIDKTNQASVTDNVLCGDFLLDATRNELCEFDRLSLRPARLRRRDALLPYFDNSDPGAGAVPVAGWYSRLTYLSGAFGTAGVHVRYSGQGALSHLLGVR